jgi:hypothetical protein
MLSCKKFLALSQLASIFKVKRQEGFRQKMLRSFNKHKDSFKEGIDIFNVESKILPINQINE